MLTFFKRLLLILTKMFTTTLLSFMDTLITLTYFKSHDSY